MRNIIFFVIVTLLGVQQIATAQTAKKPFTLNGQIEGLQVGDTLNIMYVQLPDWKELSVDTLFVSRAGQFSYTKNLEHTSFILLSHTPKDAPKVTTSIRGASILAANGDAVNLKGSIYYIGALAKNGGFYNNPIIAKFDSMENAYNTTSIDIYRKLRNPINENKPDSINKYMDMYRNFKPSEELASLRKFIREDMNDNEYAAYQYLSRLHDIPYTILNERFSKFTPEIQASYMGQRLYTMKKILKNIEIGNQPADFSVIDNKGNKVNLSDYKGRYVLLYHWGLCPGTIWVHPQLLELYAKFHDKGFDILGFTDNDFTVTNPNLKEVVEIKPLLDQPWTTVYTANNENGFIKTDYYFSGVPILMLISPDGTTLTRGFTEAFEPTRKILEEKLAN